MDPATLAHEVITALQPALPYVSTIGVAAATKTGEDLYAKGKELYQAILQRFTSYNDQKAVQTLESFVEDQDLAGAVEAKLLRTINSDPDFATLLIKILQSGPKQLIEATDDAQVRNNEQNNTTDRGVQGISGKGNAIIEGNKQNMRYE